MAVLRPDADWTDTRQAPDIAAMALWAANASEGRALTPLYLRAPDADHAVTAEWLRLLRGATTGGVVDGRAPPRLLQQQ